MLHLLGSLDRAHHFGIFWQSNPFWRSMKAVWIYLKNYKNHANQLWEWYGYGYIYRWVDWAQTRQHHQRSRVHTIQKVVQQLQACCIRICLCSCRLKLSRPWDQRFPANCRRLTQEATLVSPFGNSWDRADSVGVLSRSLLHTWYGSSQKQPEPESEHPRRPQYHLSQSAPAAARCFIFWLWKLSLQRRRAEHNAPSLYIWDPSISHPKSGPWQITSTVGLGVSPIG